MLKIVTVRGHRTRNDSDYRRPGPLFEFFFLNQLRRSQWIYRSELVRVALILSIFEMVGDAADQSLENSPGRRVDLIFERMDRVSFCIGATN